MTSQTEITNRDIYRRIYPKYTIALSRKIIIGENNEYFIGRIYIRVYQLDSFHHFIQKKFTD